MRSLVACEPLWESFIASSDLACFGLSLHSIPSAYPALTCWAVKCRFAAGDGALLSLVLIEEADGDAKILLVASGCIWVIGILRLRLVNRFAHRQTRLRMTRLEGDA